MKIAAEVFLLGLLLYLHNCSSVPSPRVDPRLVERFSNEKTATVIVHMRDKKLDEVRANFRKLTFSSRAEKLNTHYAMMKSNADTRQARVLSHLEKLKTKHNFRQEQLWIINGIVLRDVNKEVIYELARNFPEIERIDLERVFPLWDSKLPKEIHTLEKARSNVAPASISYAYDKMNSSEANAMGFAGQGVRVATIDTGCCYDHLTLIDSYGGNNRDGTFTHDYNWYDPNVHTPVPFDPHGHGCHCASTISGSYSFSPAPESTWSACQGCSAASCSDASLLACGQWVSCPTDCNGENPDCSMAPHIVSNSWGGGNGDLWYVEVVKYWKLSGICSYFANGNDGPNCKTCSSPGDYDECFAVGACDEYDAIASFSSCGPNYLGKVKPDISCYGVNIPGASKDATNGYLYMSGTSMATPLAAGCAAAIKSSNEYLTCDDLRYILRESSISRAPLAYCDPNMDATCNNKFGYGIVNTYNGVLMAQDMLTASKALRKGVKQ